MTNNEVISLNREGWNNLVKSGEAFSNTSLPEYGPFMPNEDKLKIFKKVEGKKVLEVGCAKGGSLEYLKRQGASEVWGIDISEEQIKLANNKKIPGAKFFLSPMENNPGLPENYFDYVLSLYSIGYSSKPFESIKLFSEYLKKDGKLILVWTHPFFNLLDIQDDNVIVKRSYHDENIRLITKSQKKFEFAQYNLKISTMVNYIIQSGMELDEIIEEDPIDTNNIGSYVSSFWDKRKINACTTTLILIAHKK